MASLWSTSWIFTPQLKEPRVLCNRPNKRIPLPFATKARPMVQTVAPPIVHTHVQPHFKDQHQIYHASESSKEEEEMHEDIKGIKENH